MIYLYCSKKKESQSLEMDPLNFEHDLNSATYYKVSTKTYYVLIFWSLDIKIKAF
jgi:hypothetical protein